MKQKKQIIVLAVLLVILAGVAYSYLQGDRQSVVTADALAAAQGPPPLQGVDNPQLRWDEVERARKTDYKSSGRSIFSKIDVAPPPTPTEIKRQKEVLEQQKNLPPPPPPPPTARPIPAKFYGFGVVPNGTRRLAFFAQGDDTFIVAEGEILLKSFRVIRIGNSSLEYEDLSNGVQGTCPLEEQGVTSANP
jgi:hypothetical protein